MNTCREFRHNLELVLQGRPDPAVLVPLSWNQHLLGCEACRELLEAEQALEVLLASLPEPKLPAELASRVLERLQRERLSSPARALDLDDLLGAAPDPVQPAHLATEILERVAPARRLAFEEAQLDRLLDRLPSPSVPATLAADVLAELRPVRRPSPLELLREPKLWIPLAAAAIVAALWLSRSFRSAEADPKRAPRPEPEVAEILELNDEMAEAFQVLDNWEHLQGDDLELLLASIDEVDELLIDASQWELDTDADADAEENAGG